MGFWNRKKVKDLEMRLNLAESENSVLQKHLEKLGAKLSGGRVCDGYCKNCKHSVSTPNTDIFSGAICYYTYQCELDCKCKDFERKE